MDPNPGRGSHRLLLVRPSGAARVAVAGWAIGAVAVTMAVIEQTAPSTASSASSPEPHEPKPSVRHRQPTPIRPAPLATTPVIRREPATSDPPETAALVTSTAVVVVDDEPEASQPDSDGYDTVTQAT